MQPFLILAVAAGSESAAIHLTGIDWAIVALYALTIVTVGLLVTRKPKNSEAYFLAGRSLRWPMIGASLFAANISAEHFVALAGSGFAVGIAIGAWEWSAVFCLAPLILIFLPFYIRNKIYTVPEFLERRFGPSVRMTFSLFMIVLSVLAKVSISLWAASLVMMPVFGLNNGLDLFGIHFGGVLACVACSAVVSSVFMWNSAQMQSGAASFLPYMDNHYLRPFTHSAMVAGAISVMVLVGVSLFTKAASAEQLATTTIQGATFAEADEKVAWYASYRLWLGLAIASALGLWVWFSV